MSNAGSDVDTANPKPPSAPQTATANYDENRWQILKRVAPYLWPEGRTDMKIRVVLAMFCLILAKVFTVFTPYFFKYAVDVLSNEAGNDPAFVMAIGAIGCVVAYGVFRVLGVGFAQLRDAVFAKVGQRALRQIAIETFQHIHALSLRYHLTRKTGAMIRIVERGVKGVEFLLRFMLFSVGPLILELSMVAIVFAIQFDMRYLLVIIVAIGLYIWFTFAVTEWRVRIRKEMNEADQNANQKALDSLLNYETVKYFAAEARETERYDQSMASYERFAVQTTNTLSFLNFGQSLIITIGLAAVMIMAAVDVSRGVLTVGDFVMANALMIQITMPLNFLGTVYREIRQALIDMGEMFGLLEQVPEVQDAPDAKPLHIREGKVEFNHVDFGYDPERQILHDLSLTIDAGKTLAVVGPSGSGKSTLARLLYRFYDPQSGAILIDGQNIRDVTQTSLRQAIGIVPQDTVLFNDTIEYNIGYGRPSASKDEIIEAAKSAQIHDFIMSLPQAYQTMVGERGLKLSGGEKQRVGIARTLLKNPSILILDEATSALDSETELGIIGALSNVSQGRTTLTIAHRLSTIVNSDEIVVLEKGVIVERGTHAELLKKRGKYAQMWARQQAGDEAE